MPDGDSTIRLIPADLEEVCDLLRTGHAESRYRDRPYDETRARAVLQVFLSNPGTFARGVLGDDGRIGGVMLGEISQPLWWSRERVANMAVLYVRPDVRGRAGASLLRRFKAWAKAARADVVHVGISSGIDEARTGELFARIGFNRGITIWELER
jgi:hypothetical protein